MKESYELLLNQKTRNMFKERILEIAFGKTFIEKAEKVMSKKNFNTLLKYVSTYLNEKGLSPDCELIGCDNINKQETTLLGKINTLLGEYFEKYEDNEDEIILKTTDKRNIFSMEITTAMNMFDGSYHRRFSVSSLQNERNFRSKRIYTLCISKDTPGDRITTIPPEVVDYFMKHYKDKSEKELDKKLLKLFQTKASDSYEHMNQIMYDPIHNLWHHMYDYVVLDHNKWKRYYDPIEKIYLPINIPIDIIKDSAKHANNRQDYDCYGWSLQDGEYYFDGEKLK